MRETEALLSALERHFPLRERSAGELKTLRVSGMTFETRAFQAEGLGHVAYMSARGFLGAMRMDTLVVNPLERDRPLFSCDRVLALGNDTLLAELYDTQLGPWDDGALAGLGEAYRDLPEGKTEERWYDSIRCGVSQHRKAKRAQKPRMDALMAEFGETYFRLLEEAPLLPEEQREEKRRRAGAYSEGLLVHGGASTDVFLKALGREKTERFFREVLFGA